MEDIYIGGDTFKDLIWHSQDEHLTVATGKNLRIIFRDAAIFANLSTLYKEQIRRG